MLALVGWLLTLPFRLAFLLGLRRTLVVVCLFVLAVTGYGIAEDLGLLEQPAQVAPARKPVRKQLLPNSAAASDIPHQCLVLYQHAGRRYRLPWPVLAGVGRIESDHGRSRLPGVHSGHNSVGACGPMQIGCVPGSKAGNSWATYGHGSPYDPAQAIPAAARYLVAHGAHRDLSAALYVYNHSSSYLAAVQAWARRYAAGRG
jgi:hypothetical protein